MGLVPHHVLVGISVPGYGVVLVTVLPIATRSILGVIVLCNARPEHVANIIKALCSHWWQR
jgi:hypothetical protein